MNDDVTEIQQHPVAFLQAFATNRFAAAMVQPLLDSINNRLDLPLVQGR
jgi:hypothetical protein